MLEDEETLDNGATGLFKIFSSDKITMYLHKKSAASHIPQFGDAASPAGDVDVGAGDAHF